MKVALVQMQVLEKNKPANVAHGLEMLQAVNVGTEVAILPEMWTTGYSIGHLTEQVERLDGELVQELSVIARRKKMYILAGSMAMEIAGNFYNTSLVFDPMGDLIGQYSKIHLFSLFNEQKLFSPGQSRQVLEIAGEQSGLGICYDVRFPEFFRAMALDGAVITYLPAEWPTARGGAWELLNRGSAAFNQMYICGVNCSGSFKGEEFYGHSMVVSPSGEILAMAGKQEEILYVEFDPKASLEAREHISALQDLRRDLYV